MGKRTLGWLTMLVSEPRVASGLGVCSPAVAHCIDLLDLQLVRRLRQPWMAIDINRSTTPTLSNGFPMR
jgi:hypothetical protein